MQLIFICTQYEAKGTKKTDIKIPTHKTIIVRVTLTQLIFSYNVLLGKQPSKTLMPFIT